MARQSDFVVPPEYQVMATQVTQYGEPIMPDVNPAAYGSFGRRADDPDDMHQIGMRAEVWKRDESPLKTALDQADSYTGWLKHITRTGQINTAEVTEREGGSKVTYNALTGDDQESNIKGLRIKGDPQTIGLALRSAGTTSFERLQPMDAPHAMDAAQRSMRDMPEAQRQSFQEVLARDPSALRSLAATDLAGLQSVFEVVDESGVPRPVVNPPESASNPADFQRVLNLAAQKQANGVGSRPMALYHPSQSNYEDSYGIVNNSFGALTPPQQVAVAKARTVAANNVRRASAAQANLSAKWKQQMVAANTLTKAGNNAAAKQAATAAAKTMKTLQKSNAMVTNAKARKQQVEQMAMRTGTAAMVTAPSNSGQVQKKAPAAAVVTAGAAAAPSAQVNAVLMQLAKARPMIAQTFKTVQNAVGFWTKAKQSLKAGNDVGGAKQLQNAEAELQRAAKLALQVKIPAERDFTQTYVALAQANYNSWYAAGRGDASGSASWARKAQEYAAKLQKILAGVIAAIQAAKKTNKGSTSTSKVTPDSNTSQTSDTGNATETLLEPETGTSGSSTNVPQTSSMNDATLTPGAAAIVHGDAPQLMEEYVTEDGTPEFASSGTVVEPQTSKTLKIMLTLGLIGAAGAGLYMVAKR